jgi:hypothetical protein
VSGAGYVDGLGVGNQLLELVDGGLGDHVGQRPYEKCWGIDPSGSVDQQVADCVELLVPWSIRRGESRSWSE